MIPAYRFNYLILFILKEDWCGLPQATRTREACSFADLQHVLGSDILKFNGSCKTSLG